MTSEQNYSQVLDNRNFKVSEQANIILEENETTEVKIAVGFFYVSGFELVKEQLSTVDSIKLLIGRQTDEQTRRELVKGFKEDLNEIEDTESTRENIDNFYQLIQADKVEVEIYTKSRFHPKLYLFNFESRSHPGTAIVGSSNFSVNGLQNEVELNLETKRDDSVRYLNDWFDELWEEGSEFKEDLLQVIENSKFSRHLSRTDLKHPDYGRLISPFLATKIFITEQFEDEIKAGTLLEEPSGNFESETVLARFQQDAVYAGKHILSKYNGVILSDSVGLGKTYIGAKLLKDLSNPQTKILVITPKRLEGKWKDIFHEFEIDAERTFLSLSSLSRLTGEDLHKLRDYDRIVVDEAHNMRNKKSNRYANFQRLRSGNEKILLLTATPIQNSIMDLFNLIKLFANESDFNLQLPEGLSPDDLFKKYEQRLIAGENRGSTFEKLQQGVEKLIEEVLISRTKEYIREEYEQITIGGREIKKTKRIPHLVNQDDKDIGKIYSEIIKIISGEEDNLESGLRLPYINVVRFSQSAGKSEDRINYGTALILISLLIFKRLESSLAAFEATINKLIEREKNLREIITKFENVESEEADDLFGSFVDNPADELDIHVNLETLVEDLTELTQSEMDDVLEEIEADLEILKKSRSSVAKFLSGEKTDPKIEKLKNILSSELSNEKVLIFTQYVPTAEYIFKNLTGLNPADKQTGKFAGTDRDVAYVHGDKFDESIVNYFAPEANDQFVSEEEQEIDVLIATDVLGAGHDLQDSRVVINFDLHWNPMNMEQRIGRIDRITTKHEELLVYNFIPSNELNESLGILDIIRRKLRTVADVVGQEAPILEDTEEQINKNIFMYERIGKNDVDFSDSELIDLLTKYDHLKKMTKEFCVENDVDIEELKDVIEIIKDPPNTFISVNKQGLNNSVYLSNINFNSGKKEKFVIQLGNTEEGMIKVGDQYEMTDIPIVSDDETSIFPLIKCNSEEIDGTPSERIEKELKILEKMSTWDKKILAKKKKRLREKIGQIKKICKGIMETKSDDSNTWREASEIIQTLEQKEIMDYVLNQIYEVKKKRTRYDWSGKKMISEMLELINQYNFADKEVIEKIEIVAVEEV